MARDRHEVPGDPAGALYDVLGVAAGASHQAIVHAYRRQARAAHPDAQPDDPAAPARFRALKDAYEVLSDPVRRAAYDRASQTDRARPGPQPGAHRPGQERLERPGGHRVATNMPDVFLGARPPPPWRSPLWVSPVRMEALPGEPFGEVRSEMSRDRELGELASLLLRFLTEGWAE